MILGRLLFFTVNGHFQEGGTPPKQDLQVTQNGPHITIYDVKVYPKEIKLDTNNWYDFPQYVVVYMHK